MYNEKKSSEVTPRIRKWENKNTSLLVLKRWERCHLRIRNVEDFMKNEKHIGAV